MSRNDHAILQLEKDDVAGVVDVLCDAFAEYPVMRFVLGPGHGPDSDHLRRLIYFFVMARVYRREYLFGIVEDGVLQAVALVSRPSVSGSPPELMALRDAVWGELGSAARERYEAYGALIVPFLLPEPHLHLNMIGVRHDAHGRGHARRLLEHVHAFSRDDPASSGVSLTTETEANVALYEYFGYRLLGRVEVATGLTSWGFFRPDSTRRAGAA